MIIDSDDREIKLLIGYLTVFCNLEGMFSNILNPTKAKATAL